MARINRNYEKLPGSYLFSEIARRTAAYQEANPDARLIKMGIGDVTRPLAPAVVAAMHAAVDDLAAAETFHGYGPEQGYAFLRDAIAEHDFAARNIAIDPDEIFISDGAKSDCGNIGDIFAEDNVVAVCDPVYPVYVDTNAMAGRAGDYDTDTERWTNIVYMPTTAENDFTPALPDVPVDLIYLCSPNNPTGTVLSREALQKWVDYANATDAVIHQIGKLACPNDSIIHLLHIVEPSICYEVSGVLPDEVPVPVMDQTEENEVISIAKNHLQKTAEKLSRLTDATIIQAVEDEFEISEAVINYAEKHHIDMIVVGKHNHGFLSTVFLGSVASSVMRKSPVPVLVVPVTKEEQ